MGLFGSLTGSLRKSKQLRKLQLRISPPNQQAGDLASRFVESLKTGVDDSADALEEFLDLCVNDDGVQKVMAEYQLERKDLKDIYVQLIANGLGQWVKGHYAVASSIAYFEPLLFYVESKRRNSPTRAIAGSLLFYWEGRIRQGQLIKELESHA